jgi:hypothetical protein
MRFQFRDASGIRTVNVPSWAFALFGLLAAAAGITILILGAGLLLILVPVLIVVGFVARWRLRKILREAEMRARDASPDAARSETIEVEYRVVDESGDGPKERR